MHLRSLFACLVYLALQTTAAMAAPAAPLPAAPHIEFVREYIRELGEFERLRAQTERAAREPNANLMFELVSYSTRLQLALRADIAALQTIDLPAPHGVLLRNIINSHHMRLRVHGRIKEISTAMLIGPQQGVDLPAMAAEMPNLRSMLDDIDDLFLDTSLLAFTTLLDPAPDAGGQVSRLRITNAERADLLHRLQAEFGNTLDIKSAHTLTNAAGVLRDYLGKDFTPADG